MTSPADAAGAGRLRLGARVQTEAPESETTLFPQQPLPGRPQSAAPTAGWRIGVKWRPPGPPLGVAAPLSASAARSAASERATATTALDQPRPVSAQTPQNMPSRLEYGRRVGLLARVASAPSGLLRPGSPGDLLLESGPGASSSGALAAPLARRRGPVGGGGALAPLGLLEGGSGTYKSRVLALQVELRRRLAAEAEAAPSFAAASSAAEITEAQLRIYSDVFEALLAESSATFAPILRKVKDVYDACARPCLTFQQPLGPPTPGLSIAGHVYPPCRTRASQLPSGPHLDALMRENRHLRMLAGQLYARRSKQEEVLEQKRARAASAAAARASGSASRKSSKEARAAQAVDAFVREALPPPTSFDAPALPQSVVRVSGKGVRLDY